MRKNVLGVVPSPKGHWVGDGFPVRSLFSYDGLGQHLSPFLLLDYAAPAQFAPALQPRGVGEHPHRGFETVTIVYSGELAHRDSAGNGGLIGPGDVQWMTAASGILHEEFHSPAFTQRGGELEMAQLWVNLPAKDKMSAPRYQTLTKAAIPDVLLPDAVGRVRVIAGRYLDHTGPASTFSELNVWDVRLQAAAVLSLPIPEAHTTVIAVFKGSLNVNGSQQVNAAELVVLDRVGDHVELTVGEGGATVLVLSGVPLGEPVVGYGPFVMNSKLEIEAAIKDFQAGKFGRMPAQVVPAVREPISV